MVWSERVVGYLIQYLLERGVPGLVPQTGFCSKALKYFLCVEKDNPILRVQQSQFRETEGPISALKFNISNKMDAYPF